jgi:hypothetical protein
MDTKNKSNALNDELKAARDNLDELIKQRDDLSQKICDDEFELSKLDITDTTAAISTVQRLTQKTESSRSVLEAINEKITHATNQVAAAQAKINDVASEGLRKVEFEAYQAVIQKILDLEAALVKLGDVHSQLYKSYRVLPRYMISSRLVGDINTILDDIKRTRPEVLNLPPNLTAEEKRKREAIYNVNRLRERVNTIDGYIKKSYSPDLEKTLAEARIDLRNAEARAKVFEP